MLLGADFLLRYIENYRVVWLGGRYGGGKTSLAFRLAYEYMLTGRFRYLLSTVKSVWNDDPTTCELRDGRFLDAVIILDEAGEFMASRSQAKDWLSYLRKLNIILMLPSVLPPSNDVRFLSLRRHFNGYAFGLPFWYYKAGLESGDISEKLAFTWLFPDELYGVYDTDGFPSDADEILQEIKRYTADAARNLGYENTARKQAFAGNATRFSFGDESVSTVEDIAGEIDTLSEVAGKAARTLSALERKSKKR